MHVNDRVLSTPIRLAPLAPAQIPFPNQPPQKRKALLRDISMHVGPGELCYLMGPSGAGKTTLLEVLAGRVQIGGYALACMYLD